MFQAVSAALQAASDHAPRAADALAEPLSLARAGLIDLDVTFFVQTLFFAALVLVLPKLIFDPLMDRLGHRDSRTAGARDDAKRMLKEADAHVLMFDKATSEKKQVALAERAAAREQARDKAGTMIDQVRARAAAMVEQGVAELNRDADKARVEIDLEARAIATQIADKILAGASAGH